jgi:hypothetical protein
MACQEAPKPPRIVWITDSAFTVSLTSDPEGEEADCWAKATTLQIRSPVVGKNTLMVEFPAKFQLPLGPPPPR